VNEKGMKEWKRQDYRQMIDLPPSLYTSSKKKYHTHCT
jgi:hypothetical protein